MSSAPSDVRALVVRSAGTNCDGETVAAFEDVGVSCGLAHLNAVQRDPGPLKEADILVLAGGFSYGDDIAAGRVFAREIAHRLGDLLHGHIERGGLLLGICNGFQILLELGLLQDPGLTHELRGIALTDNVRGRFECRWVTLQLHECAAEWVSSEELLETPVAHAEGRFVARDRDVVEELIRNKQVAFTYADPNVPPGSTDPLEELPYPHNPNGSTANIAGITDPSGRIVGLMPHPERNRTAWNHPRWTRGSRGGPGSGRQRGEGLALFRRMVEFVERELASLPH